MPGAGDIWGGWLVYRRSGGITPVCVETDRMDNSVQQRLKQKDTFADTRVGVDWCFLRRPHLENYSFPVEMQEGMPSEERRRYTFAGHEVRLYPTYQSLEEKQDSPTFVAIRQRQMQGHICCKIQVPTGEAGLSLYMNHEHHYDLTVRRMAAAGGPGDVCRVMVRSVVGGVSHVVEESIVTADTQISLHIDLEPTEYSFSAQFVREGQESLCPLGRLQTRYLSSEVACGFTGVMIALYAQDEALAGRGTAPAVFSDFEINYEPGAPQ